MKNDSRIGRGMAFCKSVPRNLAIPLSHRLLWRTAGARSVTRVCPTWTPSWYTAVPFTLLIQLLRFSSLLWLMLSPLRHWTAVRKLQEKRRTVEGKLERRDVVKDYSSYDSQTYAPMSRVGVFLDRGSEQNNVKSYHLSTYQGLLELEASLPDFVTQPRIQAPKPKSSGRGGFVKRKQRRQRELEEVAEAIELAKRPPEPDKPLKFLVKVEKPVPRPPTPSVEIPSQVGGLRRSERAAFSAEIRIGRHCNWRNAVNVEIKFHLQCSSIFLVHNSCCVICIQWIWSVSTETKYWAGWLSFDV